MLRATYLRPLRDVEQALSAGRGSRLSQILHHTDHIKEAGGGYDRSIDYNSEMLKNLNVLGIGDLANALLEDQQGVVRTRDEIDKHLKRLSLSGDDINLETVN